MSAAPMITTILLTYKRPRLLKKAIESVLNQTYPHFQLLICDNASGDETSAVVQKYLEKDSRIKYHLHPKNVGMIQNYKFGLSQVQTDFFSLLSDDDILLPWFYETALMHLRQSPEAHLFAGSTIIMASQSKIIQVPLHHWEKEGLFNP